MKNQTIFKHLERALDGQNQGWKFFVVILVGFLGGQTIGAIPLGIVMVIAIMSNGGKAIDPSNFMDFEAYGVNPNLGLMLMIIPFIVSLIIIILLVKAFHKRSYKEVINGRQDIRWNRFFTSFGIWAAIMIITLVLNLIFDPGNFKLQFNLWAFVPLVFISFLFIPLQAGTEEFIFRGYLAQGIAGWTKNRIAVILIPSILFALMHVANPEVKEHGFWLTMPSYFLFGAFFGLVSVLDDGIEIAMGVHAANNVLSSILITNKASVLRTNAVWEQLEVNPAIEFWALLAVCLIFIGITKPLYKWDFSILTKKIEPVLEVPSEEGGDFEV